MNDFIYDRAVYISFLGYYSMDVDMQCHQLPLPLPTFLYLIYSHGLVHACVAVIVRLSDDLPIPVFIG
jgi:hypothetical protein